MLIQTYARGYQIISYVLTNDLGDIYICRDVATGEEYTVLRVKDKAVIPGLTLSLDTGIRRDTFTDYVEHFMFEDDLCLVLKYYRGTTLANKLKYEHCTLQERMKIGKKILERVIFLGMPLYFLQNCLHGERIIVRPNLDVFFNYVPSDLRDLAGVDEQAVFRALAAVFRLIFEKELALQSAPPLATFMAALLREDHFDGIELYKKYNRMCQELALIPEEELQTPKSKWFLLWEKVKLRFKQLRRVLAIVLMIVGIIYLAYSTKQTFSPKIEHVNHFEFIGTLKIEQAQ